MLGYTAGAAIQTFEELELWDSLVTCYRLLQKKNLAEEVVQRRLKVRCHTFPLRFVRVGGTHEMVLCTHDWPRGRTSGHGGDALVNLFILFSDS